MPKYFLTPLTAGTALNRSSKSLSVVKLLFLTDSPAVSCVGQIVDLLIKSFLKQLLCLAAHTAIYVQNICSKLFLLWTNFPQKLLFLQKNF